MPKGTPKSGINKGWIKKGQKLSEETKGKIRKAHIGKTSGMNGKKHSIETKNKISLIHKGFKHNKESIKKMSGENSPQWKGGITIDINKYVNNRYKNLSVNDKKVYSWKHNKRNRLKRKTIKNIGTHTIGEWELLKKQYNYTCPCCGLSEPFNQKSKYLTEDHIIPLSKGGSDLIENIQPLCLSCNIKKHTRIIKY